MAYGIPSISVDFDTGVAREIITDGENGFLFESNNLDQLKEKMKDILTLSADDYDAVALRSKEVINCLGIDEIGKQWENFIYKE